MQKIPCSSLNKTMLLLVIVMSLAGCDTQDAGNNKCQSELISDANNFKEEVSKLGSLKKNIPTLDQAKSILTLVETVHANCNHIVDKYKNNDGCILESGNKLDLSEVDKGCKAFGTQIEAIKEEIKKL